MKNMFSVLSVVIVAVALPAISHAQNAITGQMVICRNTDNNVQRLSCYDNMTLGGETSNEPSISAVEDVEEVTARDVSAWLYTESQDPISDKDTSSVRLGRSRVISGSNDAPSALFIRCLGNGQSEIFVTSSGYIGDVRGVPMEYRWAGGNPVSERWSGSTNGTSAFLPSGFRDFRSGLAEGGGLVIRWEDFRGSRSSAEWDNVVLNSQAEFVLGGCQD